LKKTIGPAIHKKRPNVASISRRSSFTTPASFATSCTYKKTRVSGNQQCRAEWRALAHQQDLREVQAAKLAQEAGLDL
jgi:hypothetical protein